MNFVLIALVTIISQLYSAPRIDLVYPRIEPPDTLARHARVDSTFLFGTVAPPAARLIINGFDVPLMDDGAFIAYLPVDWRGRRWNLAAYYNSDSARFAVDFAPHPDPPIPDPPDVSFPTVLNLDRGALRNDLRGTYYIFSDSATNVIVDDWRDGYWRIPIAAGRTVWAPDKLAAIEPKERVSAPVIHQLILRPTNYWEDLVIPLNRRLLYRLTMSETTRMVELELFGAISHIERIHHRRGVEWIQSVGWNQVADGVVKLNIQLAGQVWGYQPWWHGDSLIVSFRKFPKLRRRLYGLTIAVDPGHGGCQPGAIGPRRIREKDVNLAVSLALKDELEHLGAEVILTRTTDETVDLNRRVETAREYGADMLISIHHNALPDGVNPFQPLGVGVRYYQPFSRELAQAVQFELAAELGLPDEGISYHDLALVRPTAMPAILIEAAYLMLPQQEKMISAPDYPRRAATAIGRGIVAFISSKRKAANPFN